jgi:hypothetical protein
MLISRLYVEIQQTNMEQDSTMNYSIISINLIKVIMIKTVSMWVDTMQMMLSIKGVQKGVF